jgi:hypothetical protein
MNMTALGQEWIPSQAEDDRGENSWMTFINIKICIFFAKNIFTDPLGENISNRF